MMDFLPDQAALSQWLYQYGSFALFGLLVLGIVAFPVPEETLLILSGLLIRKGELDGIETVIAAYAGSITGITVSYLVGRTLGTYFVLKYGKWIGITQAKLDKAHNWFERFGKWMLIIGYFIPGVRHFTGFFAGTSALDYRSFALFAYAGAIFWVTTFLSIGYFFGNYWLDVYHSRTFGIDEIAVLVILGSICLYILYKLKKRFT